MSCGFSPLESGLALAAAVGLDIAFGEPPNALHPVALMGKLIETLTRQRPQLISPISDFLYGLVVTIFCVGVAFWVGLILLRVSGGMALWAKVLLDAIALKPFFAVRALPDAATKVEAALAAEDIHGARLRLRSLVSRDPDLPEPLIVSAVVESVGENFCDSVVAPMFYFALLGLPGAAVYRAVNTLDAMIGYHGEYEWYGKAAARLDDLLNWLPGRLAGLLLCLGAALTAPRAKRSMSGARAWKVMRQQAPTTDSPNAGWSMAAMAGALAVRLEKPGHYRLNGGPDLPPREYIPAANRIYAASVALLVALLIAVLVAVGWAGH